MQIRFIGPDPQQTAKPILEALLEDGTDQVSIACAFLTGGGVELLRPHIRNLNLDPSFVVVAWATPTFLEAVAELHALIPGKVHLHLGSMTPVERGVGPGLMHSKVFFARAGQKCKLWVGSHNLTASAALGVNREAAMLVEGTVDEPVFVDALSHLNKCRDEATLFDPYDPPPAHSEDSTLVVHAEQGADLRECPWFVHLRPDSTDYDRAMRPPGAVWLYLYAPGSLQAARVRPRPLAAYSGVLTALNFTEHHPRHAGIAGSWSDADFVVDIRRGVPTLTHPTEGVATPSQGIFRVQSVENPETIWLTRNPKPKRKRVVGERRRSKIEPRFKKFFTKRSIASDELLHQEYRRLDQSVDVSRKELGHLLPNEFHERFMVHPNVGFVVNEELKHDDKFAFIYRAKFRV